MIETREPLKMFKQKWRQWATGGWGYFLAPWESKQVWYRMATPKLSDENSKFPERWYTQWQGSWEHWQLVWREKLSEARCGVRFPQSEVSAIESCPLGQFLWKWWTCRVGGAGGMAAEKEGYRTEGQTKEKHIFNLSCQRSEVFSNLFIWVSKGI